MRFLAFVLAACALPASAQVATHRLSPPTVAPGDWFGQSIAVSGDDMIVGAPYTDEAVNGTGLAFVYRREGGTWTQDVMLEPPTPVADGFFGREVDIDGDRALVGALGQDAAYVFQRRDGTWSLEAELLAPEAAPARGLGSSLALEGSVAVVASRASSSGRVLVYTLDGSAWTLTAELQSPIPASTSEFGASVDINGGRIAVGDTGRGAGEVHLYEFDGGTWSHSATLTGTAAGTNAGGQFGYSVALDADRLLVGAHLADTASGDSGRTMIYRLEASGAWELEAELIQPSPITARDYFGYDVSLRGGLAAVSAWGDDQGGAHAGRGHLYARGETGWEWVRDFVSEGDPIADNFGHHVALGEGFVAWGSHDVSLNGERGGLVSIFAVADPTGSGARPEPLAMDFRVGPSPTSGAANLAFTLDAPAAVHVSVLDILGRRVLAPESYALASGEQRVALDLSALPAGAYRVHVRTDAASGVQTLVVAR